MISIEKTSQTEFKRNYLYTISFDSSIINLVKKYTTKLDLSNKQLEDFYLNPDFLNKKAVFPERTAEVENFFWKGQTHRFNKNGESSGESDFIFFDDMDNMAAVVLETLYNLSTYLNDSAFTFHMFVSEWNVDRKTLVSEVLLRKCKVSKINYNERSKGANTTSELIAHITWGSALFNYKQYPIFVESAKQRYKTLLLNTNTRNRT